ncbi:MAG: FHA domain-containing protein [Deltaproteobacteria bacterium]|nr:FHA domain-containing protein [Deltaproteobacteria bacterium]
MVHSGSPPGRRFALRAVAGLEIGAELPLIAGRPVVVGRVEGADLVIADGSVSRRHTRIQHKGGVIVVEDLDSTNGTYVNGLRVHRAEVKVGDRILIGPTVFEILSGPPPPPRASSPPPPLPPSPPRPPAPRGQTIEAAPWVKGVLDQVGLADLLQLFSQLRKSGTLVVTTAEDVGQVDLDAGAVRFARIEGIGGGSEKALFRMLCWEHGAFELQKLQPRGDAPRVTATTQDLLLEGFRELDELSRIGPALPRPEQALKPASESMPTLSVLDEVDREILRHAITASSFQAFLDASPLTDLESSLRVRGLIERGYLRVAE